MAKSVLVLVDDEDDSRQELARELESRYGAHYRDVSCASPEAALARLTELRAAGAAVPLVLADQCMPGMSGTELLARVKDIFPTARRGLLTSWDDRPAIAPIVAAAALGCMEFYLVKPEWSPDEHFHRVVTESLEEWWREQGGRFEAVTVIAADPSPRAHEIRDVLARNSVPFGFYPSDSEEGRAALRRLRVSDPAGPVVSLYNGIVLVDPTNTEVGEALGTNVRPGRLTYDVVIVGAGPAGLAAAVYAASEGLRTALLEREAFGGQAGTSSRIRNYLGFPNGASTIEAQAVAGKPVFVVGGGNSAGQAALHLSKHARQVTILVRSRSLAMSMSEYLIREIEGAPNVSVRYRCEVAAGGGGGRLEQLLLRDTDSGETEQVPAGGLFVMIGAEPFTGWLPEAVGRDEWGFVLTGPDTGPRWPLARAPLLLETTVPGVFAAGDVRHGSVKRVASAVGEGSIAIRLVHEYLALAPTVRERS